MKVIFPLLPAIIISPFGFIFLNQTNAKLLWATLGLLFLLKIGSLIRNWQNKIALPKGLGWPAYLLLWPGMRPESFSQKKSNSDSVARDFVTGFLFFLSGLLLQLVLILKWNSLKSDFALYLGLGSFLLIIHFGFSAMIFTLYRLCGWPVERLFNYPFKSLSLREFWSQRWNLAFVDMDKRLFLPLFPKRMGKTFSLLGIFLLSGILHEVGISYPAGDGWGLPLLYFIIHGVLVLVEPSIPFIKKSTLLKRIWVWFTLIAPAPLLFHQSFLHKFIMPYFEMMHAIVNSYSIGSALQFAIKACGLGHFLILAASFQVPQKLGWKTEFSKLGKFNQKIFWTYGGYIVFCIVSFALVDLFLGQSLMDSHPSSVAIAAFIALFWSGRVIIDFVYFKHDDWPKGDIFVVGHTCLTALFCCLALTHWALVLWQLNFL
jgi:hypothetical protein